MDAQTLDPPRRILFSWTITAYLRTRPPRAVVRVRRSDATVGAVLAACGRARVSSVLANDTPDGDDDDWWMIRVRDVARAFINAYYEDTATTREDDDEMTPLLVLVLVLMTFTTSFGARARGSMDDERL